MKDIIISEKARKKKLLESPVDKTALAEVARAFSPVNLTWRYRWAISNIDMDATKELELTGVKKYWRCTGQVEVELDWLHD